jgi:hypothetical protein
MQALYPGIAMDKEVSLGFDTLRDVLVNITKNPQKAGDIVKLTITVLFYVSVGYVRAILPSAEASNFKVAVRTKLIV